MSKLKHHRVPPEEVAKLLKYDPETGVLTWLVRPSIRVPKAGAVAGTVDRLGYVLVSIQYRRVRGHTLAWVLQTGAYPEREIDHINGVKDDNRWANLREVDRSGNMRNLRRARRDNHHGLLGVTSHTEGRTFTAEITISGVRKYLGSFGTKEAAAQAYQTAKSERDADLQEAA